MRIITPDTDDLWLAYLACRYRNLYEPFGLPHSVTTSELDHPRDRDGILHRASIIESEAGTPEAPGSGAARIVCVARLDLQPDHPVAPSAQLRYFAADPEVRGKGVAREMMGALERLAIERGAQRLWMEARTAAVGFYSRLGYTDFGLGPNKYDLIPHRLLEKPLIAPL
ncbi:MAG: GNAT family N-acetyltransferase [Phycisphaerales bacterium]